MTRIISRLMILQYNRVTFLCSISVGNERAFYTIHDVRLMNLT